MNPARPRRVLLIGAGGREHALALGLAASPRLGRLWVAPGNAGTAAWNVELDIGDHAAVVGFCVGQGVDFVVIGPEAPLVAGLVDDLTLAGVPTFGPRRTLAALEGSKACTRELAAELELPSPRFAVFADLDAALAHIDACDHPLVVKADGLAGGKGVLLPDSAAEAADAVRSLMVDGALGRAGRRVVLEERLFGPEVSLIGLSDGRDVVVLPPVQDHKRLLDGDGGPNTGGMGAFAPTPTVAPTQLDELAEIFLRRPVRALADRGTPYVGALYAGLMLTADGPRLLEYNCRFGDPEAQVLLPLIETPLLDVLEACVDGALADVEIDVSDDAAATVVVASDGYPGPYETGRVVSGLADAAAVGATVFQAGTTLDASGEVRTSGGRVLAVTGRGPDLGTALDRAYAGVAAVSFRGAQHRTDIGAAARTAHTAGAAAYAAAGVSLSVGDDVVDRIGQRVVATHDSRVLRGIGSFGGALSLTSLQSMVEPVLVASTDGVGTKTLLAAQTDRWEVVGTDVVNHGINDVLVQNARPLAFLDTVAAGRLDADVVERIVGAMADACASAGCVLLGGETAEMPGVIESGAVDVSGTLIGVGERAELLPTADIEPGHVLIGLAADGLHTNGWSLARTVVAGRDLSRPRPGAEVSLADELMVPHRSYLGVLDKPLRAGLVAALAHITGGGIPGNLPRCLPEHLGATVDLSTWPIASVQAWLAEQAGLDLAAASRIWNLGIGMICVVAPDRADELRSVLGEPSWTIGEITAEPGVRYVGR